MPRRCVLFVHGIGPQQEGYSDELWSLLWRNEPPADVRKYELFYYDVFETLNAKTEISNLTTRLGLSALLDSLLAGSSLAGRVDDTVTGLLRDCVSHVLYYTLHADARNEILNRFKRAVITIIEEARDRGFDPPDVETTIVSHSLGTAVSYQGLHECVAEPGIGLQDGVRFRTLYTLATPLALVAAVAGRVGVDIPHVTDAVSVPGETDPVTRRFRTSLDRWYSYREKPDPVASLVVLNGPFLSNNPDVPPFFFEDLHGYGVHAFKGYIEQSRGHITDRVTGAS